MTYHLGVDLGATITTAAVHRAGRASVVLLGEYSAAMPSVLLWPDEGAPLVGDDAVRAAADAPGRVARDIRARLTDPAPFLLDGAPFAASALLGVLLRRVVDRTAEREGGAPDAIVLTHPATWGDTEREALAGVAASLGLGAVELVPAPVAAACAHAAERAVPEGGAVAVVELGVGSVEATVLRHRAGTSTVLGRPESKPHEPDAEPDDRVIADVLRRTLASAGVAPADLDVVLLVGRSTRMGSAAAVLGVEIGRPVTAGAEPEHAVAAGAAHLAARRSEAMTSLAPVAAVGPTPRPRPVVADEPETGPVRVAPAPVPVPPPSPRPRRRGLVTVLAAATIVLGGVGGGAYALVGAAAPAEAAPPAVVPAETVPAPATTTTPAPTATAVASTTERDTPRTREAPRRPRSTTTTSSASSNSSGGSSGGSSGSSGSSHHGSGSHGTTDPHGTDTRPDDTDHGGDTAPAPADPAPAQTW
ncbi:Hsp70 family protein [Actinomycetospora lutea]|uniref:Hsp70 family protein n=1 Tax=Actinomycetospora lutea TaxID=663604 RepID=UPI00236506DF|nr:Hsp70 family protein [Actinomycetospora lutea]MDD7941769.1 Hsp70 family protein [Actinomycetospora lutea]